MKTKPTAIQKLEKPEQPFSTCVRVGNLLYFGSVVAINNDGEPCGNSHEQVRQVIKKMVELLKECELSLADIYELTVIYIHNTSLHPYFCRQWNVFLGPCETKPICHAFAVAGLPCDCAVQVKFSAICPYY